MSLSGKREGHDIFQFGDPVGEYYAYKEEDVKEFINKLKEEIKDSEFKLDPKNLMWEDVCMIIDKLAGKKLTSLIAEETKNEI